jgi:hypothetical protein
VGYSFFLIFIILFFSSRNRRIAKFVRVLTGRNHSQVITQLLLFQISFREVLELTLGKVQVRGRCDRQLGTISGNDDVVGRQRSRLARNLDAIVQVFLKRGNIQNGVIDWLRAVNDKLDCGLFSLDLNVIGYNTKKCE